jgi:cytochrome c biogenesis protein ResB
MTKQKTLQIIFAASVVGAVFSGMFAWQEKLAQHLSVMGASFGISGSFFGQPATVYLCAWFVLIMLLTGIGLQARK